MLPGQLPGSDYYPFGLAFNSYQSGLKNDYLYNGKELQDELDLNWYDYGARNYDATLGRFFNQDRFAENYNDLSPYQYGRNNPMLFVDINGDSTAYYDNAGALLYMSHDGLENAVTVVNDENKGEFFKTLIKDLMNEQSSDLRSFGTSYMLDGLESRFEGTKGDKDNGTGGEWYDGLSSEHGSFLYESSGEVRIGDEDFPGGPATIIFSGKNESDDYVGYYHTHPNSGRRDNRRGGALQDPPSKDGQMNDRNHEAKRGYRNAVVTPSNVYLYNKGQNDIVFDRKKRFQ
ncbi:MAG: RHS repeat-associated core domain-containing protein [Imperialibacter sp.]|uniref:RHS repeat-associated core domain-containing protein n=1 Tax=Imperialibacter sp. TaxID=2038411 RepID=UPI0032EB464B